ncbi:hypothetical protein RchiOBHm_Chr5g0034081 [Rosa chinensis]|uniref:Uncharacterized protein n=1 Tax=Rosa chinensis TaxID=74649 RepID=A0A2P6QAV4_ROSCH|nr:hypothetical protein RchiOBHm_Chr5g0034081 [Rosa chinensis]
MMKKSYLFNLLTGKIFFELSDFIGIGLLYLFCDRFYKWVCYIGVLCGLRLMCFVIIGMAVARVGVKPQKKNVVADGRNRKPLGEIGN